MTKMIINSSVYIILCVFLSQSTYRFAKLFHVAYEIAAGVDSLCRCDFTSANIQTSSSGLYCQSSHADLNFILVHLRYHSLHNNRHIDVFMRRWVEGMNTISVFGTQFTVAANCSDFSSTNSSPLNTGELVGIVLGGIFVVAVGIFVLVFCIVRCARKRKPSDSEGHSVALGVCVVTQAEYEVEYVKQWSSDSKSLIPV